MTLRVAVVAPCGYPTTQGSQVYIRGTSRALQDAGHDVQVVTYHYGEPGTPDAGVPVVRIPGVPGPRKLRSGPSAAKPFLDLQLALRLGTLVRRAGIQVVHAHNVEGPFAAWAARAMGVPVVQHVHTLAEDELPTYVGRGRRLAARAGRVIDGAMPRLADAVIALSIRAKVRLVELGADERSVFVVPPGVDPQEVGPRVGVATSPVVLYAGNPDAYQEPETLLAAFARLRSRRPDAVLRLVSGSSMEPWVSLARGLGVEACAIDVRRVSGWPAVRAAFEGAAVAAVPRSVCAGFPIKLLNYMAAGLPTVACGGAAGPLDHRRTGWVVPNRDVEAFAHGLDTLLASPDLRDRMGRAARTSVFSEHTWRHRAAAIEAVHRSVVPPDRA